MEILMLLYSEKEASENSQFTFIIFPSFTLYRLSIDSTNENKHFRKLALTFFSLFFFASFRFDFKQKRTLLMGGGGWAKGGSLLTMSSFQTGYNCQREKEKCWKNTTKVLMKRAQKCFCFITKDFKALETFSWGEENSWKIAQCSFWVKTKKFKLKSA